EVVYLLINVVAQEACVFTSLRFENTYYFALPLDGASLRVDSFQILVVENDSRRILGVLRCTSLCSLNTPLRNIHLFVAEDGCMQRHFQQQRCREKNQAT